MKTYSVTMTISVNTTVEASSEKAARALALTTFWNKLSEFDRRVNSVEDITLTSCKPIKGRESY